MIDRSSMESFTPEPGSIIRTDYLSILRLVRDKPGINRTSVARALPCSPSTSSKKKRIDELVRFGIITENEDGLSRRLNLTEKGVRILDAAERLIEEVYRCPTTTPPPHRTAFSRRMRTWSGGIPSSRRPGLRRWRWRGTGT